MNNNVKKNFLVVAYYQFSSIQDPLEEVKIHQKFFEERDITCRIYISEQGINGQLSGANADALAYMEWMHSRPEYSEMKFKTHPYHENVFPRKTVKYRKQLVALDADVDLNKRGEYVSPREWKEMLTSQEKILLDVRNTYEWKLGRFSGAETPDCETFREFRQYADDLREKIDAKTTPVMMYCTGGIRCELYSAVLKEKGFEKVYQLDGGIINYGLQEGASHWLGKLFVFDDRLSVPIADQETPIVGTCHHCGQPNEAYYNCANMDCNFLFLCCQTCLKQFEGCCCKDCQKAPRLRPYHQQNAHKPFRRAHQLKMDCKDK